MTEEKEDGKGKEKAPEGLDKMMEKLQEKLQGFLGEQYGVKVMMPGTPGAQPAPKKIDQEPEKKDENPKPDFKLLPSELEEQLRKYVIGQEEPIRALATKICTHFHRVAWEESSEAREKLVGEVKSNMLIIGPTGVGKTYAVRLIADMFGVPMVKGDATKFSETGYVGADVEQLVRDLVHQANGDIPTAEHGIIYLDEIDKIASSGTTHGPDVSRTGVQRNLLKLMEESEVDLRAPFDLSSQMEAMMEAQRTGKVQRRKVNTRDILFIMSGAFDGLVDIIQTRLQKKVIGFEASSEEPEDPYWLLSQVKSEDLMTYGFEPEFIGRLPIVVVFHPLDEDKLFQILKNPVSPLTQGKVRDFASYGIELDLKEDALSEIAGRASKEGTGARGLKSILERRLMPLEHAIPGSGIKKVEVTEDMVLDPEGSLKKILVEGALVQFVTEFRERSGIRLSFTARARGWLVERAADSGRNVQSLCEELFSEFEYGLQLAGRKNLRIGVSVCKDPRRYLDSLIKKAYEEREAIQEGDKRQSEEEDGV